MEVKCWTTSSVTVDYENVWRESLPGKLGVRWSIAISITSFIEVGYWRYSLLSALSLIWRFRSQNREYFDLTNRQYQDY